MTASGPRDVYVHHVSLMGTVVTIQVVGNGETDDEHRARVEAVERAIGWFRSVEVCCSRFDPESELRQLSRQTGHAVRVSEMLFEAVRFAVAVAADTDGAFDPTVGVQMERRGFNRNYRTGEMAASGLDGGRPASYRDVVLDDAERTIALARPLVLDLGAVAKGLAIDNARLELGAFPNCAIDAGGDMFLAGRNRAGQPWAVGIRHPRKPDDVIETVHVSDTAVCTSGDYERRAADGTSHILDPAAESPAAEAASATVIAPTAMVADALATAAFVLGPVRGIAMLERHGVEGLIVTPALERSQTSGFAALAHD